MSEIIQFQSPPSVRKATGCAESPQTLLWISIPAFREEGDLGLVRLRHFPSGFQSPPSVRKATFLRSLVVSTEKNFNPRLP